MAYVSTPTKSAVKKLTDIDYEVSINYSIEDDGNPGVILLEGVVSTRWNSSINLDDAIADLEAQIENAFDLYIDQKQKYDSIAFTNALTTIKTAVDDYMNE